MSIRNKLTMLGMAILLVGLAACGKQSSDQPKAEAAATPSPAAEPADPSKPLIKWKHGLIKLQTAAGFELMALQKEYFRKHGIDMEYQEFISAPLMAQALSSGALDSIESNPIGVLLADSKGGNLKIIGSTLPGIDFAIYADKSITKVADLQGKRIGTSAARDLPDLVMRAIFQKNGMNPENATYAAVGGNADRVNALASGSIDADVNSLDMLPVVEANPKLHMLLKASDVVPDFPRLMVMVDANRIKSKPREAVVGVLAGMMEGMKYAVEHKDEALKISAKVMGLPPTDPRIGRYYDAVVQHKWISPDMAPQTEKVDYLQDFALSLGMIPAKLPQDKIMDMSYRDEAYKLVYGSNRKE